MFNSNFFEFNGGVISFVQVLVDLALFLVNLFAGDISL